MKKANKIKRILAIIGVVLLAGMYLVTLLLAILDHSAASNMFRASFACTIAVPIMLYAYILVYKWTRKDQDTDEHKNDAE